MKNLSNILESIFDTDKLDGQLGILSEWQWFVQIFVDAIKAGRKYTLKDDLSTKFLAGFQKHHINAVSGRKAHNIIKKGGVIFMINDEFMTLIKVNRTYPWCCQIRKWDWDQDEITYWYRAINPAKLSAFSYDRAYYPIPVEVFAEIVRVSNEAKIFGNIPSYVTESLFDTDELDNDLKSSFKILPIIHLLHEITSSTEKDEMFRFLRVKVNQKEYDKYLASMTDLFKNLGEKWSFNKSTKAFKEYKVAEVVVLRDENLTEFHIFCKTNNPKFAQKTFKRYCNEIVITFRDINNPSILIQKRNTEVLGSERFGAMWKTRWTNKQIIQQPKIIPIEDFYSLWENINDIIDA